jgi:hypothetical protein
MKRARERYPRVIRWAVWVVFPLAIWALVFWASIARAQDFTPSQTVPLASPEVYHQLRMEWFLHLQRQPGGICPGTPNDSRPGRISVYS